MYNTQVPGTLVTMDAAWLAHFDTDRPVTHYLITWNGCSLSQNNHLGQHTDSIHSLQVIQSSPFLTELCSISVNMASFSATLEDNAIFSLSEEDIEESELTSDHVMPQAYAFEPVVTKVVLPGDSGSDTSSKELSDSGDSEDPDREPERGPRFRDLSWCECHNCSVGTLNYDWECICCHEISAIQHRIELQEDTLICITLNHYFSLFCLDVEALDMFLLSMADVKAESLTRPLPSW